MTYWPLSPKMLCRPSCTRPAKPGYSCGKSVVVPSAPTARSFAWGVHYTEIHLLRLSIPTPAWQITHLAHDRRNTARAEPRSAAFDQFSERAEELAFGECGLEHKEMTKDTDGRQQFLCWVGLHGREERRVQRIRYFELVRVLSQEEHTFIDQNNETQYLPQITAGDPFFFVARTHATHTVR
jgi:hypothetical protein